MFKLNVKQNVAEVKTLRARLTHLAVEIHVVTKILCKSCH